jgi:hypothetical protein
MRCLCAVAIALMLTVRLTAQPETADPLRCWWRTSAGAVSTSEPFDATLTCAVREVESSRTAPDESRLAAAVIQLAPFEVLGGSHPRDLRTPTHRFLQYHYTLRIIDSNVIGGDAKFPDLQIAYRVHTLTNGEWTQGRDRVYIMPGQLVRVLSLVPLAADDIRDSGNESFDTAAQLRFRSRALQIAALAFVLLGGVVLVPAIATLLRRRHSAEAVGGKALSRRVLVAAVQRELAAIRQESRGGWTPDLAARALNALRLGAACALNRDVAHGVSGNGAPAGRVAAFIGLLRRREVGISSAITPLDVEKAIAALPLTASHERRRLLDELLQAMRAMTAALYGTAFAAQDGALDESLETATSVASRLRTRT